jgi:hypothetical protein
VEFQKSKRAAVRPSFGQLEDLVMNVTKYELGIRVIVLSRALAFLIVGEAASTFAASAARAE